MTYQITEISQQSHPEIGVKATEINQEIVIVTFDEFQKECYRLTDYKKTMNFRTLKTYYFQGLSPVQAVKKYSL